MAKAVKVNLDLTFNIEGVQDGKEDVSQQVELEYAQRRRADGKVKQADGDVTIPVTGMTPKVFLLFNRGGGSISIRLSGHTGETMNVQDGGFVMLTLGSVSGIIVFTGSSTDVKYDYLMLGD